MAEVWRERVEAWVGVLIIMLEKLRIVLLFVVAIVHHSVHFFHVLYPLLLHFHFGFNLVSRSHHLLYLS